MKYPQRYLIKSVDLYTQLLWHLPQLYDKSGSHQSLATALETLKSALQGLETPMSFTLMSGDQIDSEKCVFVVLEFSTFDHGASNP